MTRRSLQALAAAAAGACLALCGCGAGAAPTAAGSSPAATTGATAGGGFCANATNFMKTIPSAPASKHLTTAQARANMAAVLATTVKGYAGLEKQAPAGLRQPLRKIVDLYRNDEKILSTTGDMAEISQSMVQSDNRGARSFEKVLRYLGANCRGK